jgi:hypothetical protein
VDDDDRDVSMKSFECAADGVLASVASRDDVRPTIPPVE